MINSDYDIISCRRAFIARKFEPSTLRGISTTCLRAAKLNGGINDKLVASVVVLVNLNTKLNTSHRSRELRVQSGLGGRF